MNKDYGRHILRTWVDTHKKNIRMDPEIYLSGEIDTKNAADDDGDTTSCYDEDDSEDDSEDEEDEDDEDENEEDEGCEEGEDEGELVDIRVGMKRKAPATTRSDFPTKIAKTMAWAYPSTTAQGEIDDHHRADLTLIDAPVDEHILTHPYGRHGCLYVEVKVDANKKPNPLKAVSGPLPGSFITKAPPG